MSWHFRTSRFERIHAAVLAPSAACRYAIAPSAICCARARDNSCCTNTSSKLSPRWRPAMRLSSLGPRAYTVAQEVVIVEPIGAVVGSMENCPGLATRKGREKPALFFLLSLSWSPSLIDSFQGNGSQHRLRRGAQPQKAVLRWHLRTRHLTARNGWPFRGLGRAVATSQRVRPRQIAPSPSKALAWLSGGTRERAQAFRARLEPCAPHARDARGIASPSGAAQKPSSLFLSERFAASYSQ